MEREKNREMRTERYRGPLGPDRDTLLWSIGNYKHNRSGREQITGIAEQTGIATSNKVYV